MMRICWAVLLFVGVPSVARSQQLVDSVISDSFHLIGPNVVRHKPIGVTKQRVLLRGVRRPNGACRLGGKGPSVVGWSEWEEEFDPDTCTSIHGQGPGDGGPHLNLNRGKLRDTLLRSWADTADTQAVRRKKKP
jgi:hypothetical protein